MSFTTRRFYLAALAACAILIGLQAPASAISIAINSIAKNPGNTADFVSNNATNDGEFLSAVSVLNGGSSTPDVVSASVGGATRYASVLGSDAQAANFGGRGDSATSNYKVTFTVTPDFLTTVYSIAIDTARRGALVNREEGGAAGTETINGVTGSLNNVATGTLALPGLAAQNSNATAVTAINQASSTLVISGLSGVQVFTLDFNWTQSTNSGNNLITGGDEAVVLLGLAGTNPDFGASDDYPGTANRTQANDGHFVNIAVTVTDVVIPEPSTFLLAGMAGMGMGMVVWRRRKL